MMPRLVLCFTVVLSFYALICGIPALAQSETLDYQINALRSDLKADKAEIVKEAMNLNAEDSKKFWPVYKDYDEKLSGINDELVQLIKEYANKYGSINDADAKQMTMKAFDLQEKKVELRKKYFDHFSKATSPLTAAKFFQVENRLELLFNLKLASELPALLYQKTPAVNAAAPKSR
jgi:hypothetical protein